ncbi:MAG: uncharacterized protein KVP18_004431 [Porospora cf. gigantea A]|uniref:uncharacterized protein n=1 Tax=Porospora cf. gigantea A TaxID=2853593 RepID=UPI003559C93E|nr:MAG: hypothetical protein KVP18_004431 [Porospora cf. gigantea A]
MKENDSLTSQWESSVKESASNDSIDDSLVTLTAMDSRSFLEDAADLMSNIVTLQPVSVNLGIVSRDFQGVRELPSAWVPALAWFVAGAEPPNLENLPQEAAGRCLSCAREKGLMVGAQSIKPLTPLDIEALFIKNEWSGIKPRNHAVLFCLPPISGIVLPGAVLFDINDRISVDALFETLGNMMESGFPIEAGAVSVMASHAIDSLEEEVDELVASVAIKVSRQMHSHAAPS